MLKHPSANAEMAVTQCIAFEGTRRIASGELSHVALAAKAILDGDRWASVLIFDDATSELIDVDFRGTPEDVAARHRQTAPEDAATPISSPTLPEPTPGPGRPRLGVVAREVTLLPRHWDWLSLQPGGASVALRRLVEEARRASVQKDRVRQSQETTYRFLSAIAGDLPGFEVVTRALFAGDRTGFEERTEPWPADVRDHARKLAVVALQSPAESVGPA